jgi:hypothetical protein
MTNLRASCCSHPLFSFSPSALTRLTISRSADLCEVGPNTGRVLMDIIKPGFPCPISGRSPPAASENADGRELGPKWDSILVLHIWD